MDTAPSIQAPDGAAGAFLEQLKGRIGKIKTIFSYFDEDGDGMWNLEEANNATEATGGNRVSASEFGDLCGLLETDRPNMLSLQDVTRMYLDERVFKMLGSTVDQAEADYSAVMAKRIAPLSRILSVSATERSRLSLEASITTMKVPADTKVWSKGGFSPGILWLERGECILETGENAPLKRVKSGSLLGSANIGVGVPLSASYRAPMSKSERAQAKRHRQKQRRWVSKSTHCNGVFDRPAPGALTTATPCMFLLVPAHAVIRTAAAEEKFAEFLGRGADVLTISGPAAGDAKVASKVGPQMTKAAPTPQATGGIAAASSATEAKADESVGVALARDLENFSFDPENFKLSWQEEEAKRASPTAARGPTSGATRKALGFDISAEQKMRLETVFSFFDRDGDGFWGYADADAMQRATEGVPMMRDEFDMVCDMLGANSAKGYSRDDVSRIYLDPEFKALLGMSDEMIAEDALGKDFKYAVSKGSGDAKQKQEPKRSSAA